MIMKNVRLTARRSLAYLGGLGLGLFIIHACGNNNPDDPKEIAEEQNDERFDDRKAEKDANFLVEAAAINLEEIKLGELALQKGMMDDTKELGKMMVKEHTAAMKDLKKLADSKSITIPEVLTEDGQDAYDDLNEETGKDFDKEYCSMMVRGHKSAIRKFENASSNAEDPDIRNWATSMLPALRAHLENSNICKEKCKAMK
jgi:putative membrane protein